MLDHVFFTSFEQLGPGMNQDSFGKYFQFLKKKQIKYNNSENRQKFKSSWREKRLRPSRPPFQVAMFPNHPRNLVELIHVRVERTSEGKQSEIIW